ncbi:MAG TPA: hypothetical protein VF746_06800 [Longimicrobium sp.]|jgi:hypothetical protein
MKKLTLEIDELAVETFAADGDAGMDAGTVEGQELAPTILKLCTAMTGLCPCTPHAADF